MIVGYSFCNVDDKANSSDEMRLTNIAVDEGGEANVTCEVGMDWDGLGPPHGAPFSLSRFAPS